MCNEKEEIPRFLQEFLLCFLLYRRNHASHGARRGSLSLRCDVRIGVQRKSRAEVSQHTGERFGIDTVKWKNVTWRRFP